MRVRRQTESTAGDKEGEKDLHANIFIPQLSNVLENLLTMFQIQFSPHESRVERLSLVCVVKRKKFLVIIVKT
jgi:hypothetical protein